MDIAPSELVRDADLAGSGILQRKRQHLRFDRLVHTVRQVRTARIVVKRRCQAAVVLSPGPGLGLALFDSAFKVS